MADQVLLEIEGWVATITLNRPEKLNAISPLMLDQLEEALVRLEHMPELRVVIIQGAGERAFCIGADINAWAEVDPLDMWRQWTVRGHRVFERLVRLHQPVIAALNGHVFGGGLELALAADLRLIVAGADCAMPEVKVATVPGWGGTRRLPALVGFGRAKQMILTGERIDSETAVQWGLANEVVPVGQLTVAAASLAAQLAQNAPVSVQLAKQLLNASEEGAGLPLEALAGSIAAHTGDAKEGIEAFRQRRSPKFKGR